MNRKETIDCITKRRCKTFQEQYGEFIKDLPYYFMSITIDCSMDISDEDAYELYALLQRLQCVHPIIVGVMAILEMNAFSCFIYVRNGYAIDLKSPPTTLDQFIKKFRGTIHLSYLNQFTHQNLFQPDRLV